jgi:hypothetical protein
VVAVGSVPGLSELLAWPVEHLTEAAAYWQTTGAECDDVFDRIWRDSVSIDWQGDAAEALRTRTQADATKVGGVHDQLEAAAGIARSGASDLCAARARLRYAVEDALAAGFDVGEDLSLTDRFVVSSAAEWAVRQAEADALAADIVHSAMRLVALDNQVAGRITAAVNGIGTITFDDRLTERRDREASIQAVDFHAPIPERPNVEPEPPPGGWSDDPLKRAAQKMAYGHAGDEHLQQFPGMTRAQLADVVEDMFRRSIEDPGSLIIGRTPDGVPALYDPKTDVLIIRDPKALDMGTVFKPDRPSLANLQSYLGRKIPTRVTSIPRGDLLDRFPRSAIPGEPRSLEPPGRSAPAPAETPPLIRGGGPVPPESTMHPVHPPHSHHGPPVLGKDELPDLDEFTPAP